MTRKIIFLAVLVFIGLFVMFNPLALGPEPNPTSIAVQVPDGINLAIGVGLTALMALGANYLFEVVGLDLSAFATPVAIAVSAFVVGELQRIIDLIPASYDPTLDFILKVIVILLGSVGLLRFRKPALPINAAGHVGLLS